MRLSQWKTVIVGSAQDINRNHTLAFAAALSYYFVMAFFPALIGLAAIIAYLPIPNLFNTMVSTLSRVMPPESMGLVRKVVAEIITPNRGALLSFGLLGTLWSASGGFANMIEALNVAYDIPETRPIWKTRLLALELTFEVGTLILFAFSVMIVGPEFGAYLASHLGVSWAFAIAWPYLRYIIAVSFVILAVEGLYFLGPNLKQRFRDTLPGAMLAVVGWILLSTLLSLYVHHVANLNQTYGVLGGGIALLLWMYWSSFAILVGAELNSEIIQERGDGKLALKQPPPAKVEPRPATTAEEAQPAA
ncbi:MAG: YihY/virulence factor BrkB family protein [Candidatus Korobacteraceae bacterium]